MLTGDYLSRVESRLLFDAVWHRLYIPSMQEIIQLVGAVERLSLREQEMMSYRFASPQGAALKEVAAAMGLSRERARQLDEGVVAKLREAVGTIGGGP